MKLSLRAIGLYNFAAGWKNTRHLAESIATVFGESDGETTALHTNADGSVDQGMWAINNVAHPEVTLTQALDPQWASMWAYRLFRTHNGWSPWYAYGGERYQLVFDESVLMARQTTEAVGWPFMAGWSLRWDFARDQYVYRRIVDGVVTDETITAPKPDLRSGFTVWDAANDRWTYASTFK